MPKEGGECHMPIERGSVEVIQLHDSSETLSRILVTCVSLKFFNISWPLSCTASDQAKPQSEHQRHLGASSRALILWGTSSSLTHQMETSHSRQRRWTLCAGLAHMGETGDEGGGFWPPLVCMSHNLGSVECNLCKTFIKDPGSPA